jgi:hypothetical protein
MRTEDDMTATATIDETVCLRPSTSTGFSLSGVIDSVLQPVHNLPGAALDKEPDDLYVTTDPHGGADHAVWPGDSTFSAGGAQIPLGIQLTADGSREVLLRDQDDVSADDLLGWGRSSLSKLAHSEEERSYYYVQYHVD